MVRDRGGQEMPDEAMLAEFVKGKANHDVITLYLVVRFPGASFALTSEEDGNDELPVTVGEEGMNQSSRIVLRGTVTIPVPERDMNRVVHRLPNRAAGAEQSSLQDLVSSMSYLPRYRVEDGQEGHATRRAAGLGHRRRRRRRTTRTSGFAVDLRAHSVAQINGQLSSFSAGALRPSAGSSLSWSRYLHADETQSLLPRGFDAAYVDRFDEDYEDDELHDDDSLDQDLLLPYSQRSADGDDAVGAEAGEEDAAGCQLSVANRGLRHFGSIVLEQERLGATTCAARATSVACSEYGGSYWRGAAAAAQLNVARMSGRKRKHAEKCGHGAATRLTVRCCNHDSCLGDPYLSIHDLSHLSLEDTAAGDGVECAGMLAFGGAQEASLNWCSQRQQTVRIPSGCSSGESVAGAAEGAAASHELTVCWNASELEETVADQGGCADGQDSAGAWTAQGAELEHERKDGEKHEGPRASHDQERGIHISSDPLATLPLVDFEHAPALVPSNVVFISALSRASLALRASDESLRNAAEADVTHDQVCHLGGVDCRMHARNAVAVTPASDGPPPPALAAVYKTHVETLEAAGVASQAAAPWRGRERSAEKTLSLSSRDFVQNKCCVVM